MTNYNDNGFWILTCTVDIVKLPEFKEQRGMHLSCIYYMKRVKLKSYFANIANNNEANDRRILWWAIAAHSYDKLLYCVFFR